MVIRSALVQLIEWRARRFADPADRLQFLRRNFDLHPNSRRWTRIAKRTSVLSLTLAAMAGLILWLSAFGKQIALAHTNAKLVFLPGNSSPPTRNPSTYLSPVWLVQSNPQFDLYSNGLRIEDQYVTSTVPRRYLAFANRHLASISSAAEWRTEVAGIVYHTTESALAPFEENHNQSLRRDGAGVLEYVHNQRAYHFVIDRFGRVFRVVRESDYANHAGNSIWADQAWIYINLNQSFIGIAFEAHSNSEREEPTINPAQVYAGRILTQMLRARYGIPASNCVTHAQVSINPENRRVGYHIDWAANLPFAELGLADNYRLALPSIGLFGFEGNDALMNDALTKRSASSIAQGLARAEEQIRLEAAAQRLPIARYREKLQKQYRDAIRAQRGTSAHQEYN
jgi:hypothetical protein